MEERFEGHGELKDSSDETAIESWLTFKDLFVHPLFFSMGLIVVSTEPKEIGNKFFINSREFSFGQTSEKSASSAFKKANTLFNKLTTFYSNKQSTSIPVAGEYVFIHNLKRRDEVFLPLRLQENQVFIYPWLDKASKNYIFAGFTSYVSAGCMFGATLIGVTQYDEKISLINHRLELRANTRIISIDYDETAANPFEEMQFKELEKSCLMMRALAKDDKSTLLYHLPYYDYILFGLKLYIRNEMTETAFNQFCNVVLKKELIYRERIKQICNLYDIDVKIGSPFDNLIVSIDTTNPLDFLLKVLDINARPLSEKDVVASCIVKLKTNLINDEHKLSWEDIFSSSYKMPEDIEGLLQLANAFMLAVAAKDKKNYEVCSLLPLSEKQIQVEYTKLNAKLDKTVYGAVFNLNQFEPVITYSPTTNGLLFYLATNLSTLSSLLRETEVYSKASENVGFFQASKDSSTTRGSLSSILSTKK